MDDYDALSGIYDRLQASEAAERLAANAADLIASACRPISGRGDGRDGRLLLLDLGCGTGSFSRLMTGRDFDVIGVDGSEGMLRQATEAAPPNGPDILYLQQDITRFELFGTVDAICCLTDTVNHVTAKASLQRMLRLCRQYLNPGGVLVFDIATRRHFARRLGDRLLYEVGDEAVVLWKNRFSEKTGCNVADIVLFSRNPDGRWSRGDETIRERTYDRRTLAAMLRQAGFARTQVLDAFRLEPPSRAAERLFYVATRDAES